jgi:CBS domain containing-hemolysin-like protein
VTRRGFLPALAVLGGAYPAAAHASFLSGDALDSVATFMAWFIVFVVPVVAVGIFLVIHVIPEKIAERNHHPQQAAIKTLCFLSLVFGGLLWPLAWLWAFTRPVGYRMAYGTEKHENYFHEMGEKAGRGELTAPELDHLRDEVAQMASRGPLPPKLRELPAILAQARPKAADAAAGAKPGGAK